MISKTELDDSLLKAQFYCSYNSHKNNICRYLELVTKILNIH